MRVILVFLIAVILFGLFDRGDDEPQEEDWGSYNEER